MRIVIDLRPVFKNGFSVEVRKYIFDCLAILSREKPQAEFCILADHKRAEEELAVFRANIIPIRPGSHIFPGFTIWTDRNLTRIIRAKKADLFLSIGAPTGRDFGLPVCNWLFESNLPGIKKSFRWRPATSWLLTGSMTTKSLLLKEGLFMEDKIQMVPLAVEDSRSMLTWTEKESLKVKYAGGREYFISRSTFSEENLLLLLKAFSGFKKRQQSNMQLLITGMKGDTNHAGFEKLDTYKFRGDVHIYASLDAAAFYQTTAAAYALILPGDPGTGIGILNTLQAQVPVICANDERLKEAGGETVLYATAGEPESFCEQMSLVFKDEILRGDFIRKGKIQAQKFMPQPAVSAIWNGMMRALEGSTRSIQ